MTHGMPLKRVRAVKPKAVDVFRKLVGDVAVGITRVGTGRYGLKVNLTTQPVQGLKLPDDIDGVPVKVEVVGRIRKR